MVACIAFDVSRRRSVLSKALEDGGTGHLHRQQIHKPRPRIGHEEYERESEFEYERKRGSFIYDG